VQLLIQEEVTLQAGVAFAPMKDGPWGPTSVTAKNSLAHLRTSPQHRWGKELTFSYTQALDGSVQSLGVKITFRSSCPPVFPAR